MTGGRLRRGIALPMVLLVLLALAVLSALALTDALLAARVAGMAEDEARAHGVAVAAAHRLAAPPDLAWLCLQPPSQALADSGATAQGERWAIRWWLVAPGVVRAELTGASAGARHRRVAWLRPDSLDPADLRPGCPDAQRLVPTGTGWMHGHPDG